LGGWSTAADDEISKLNGLFHLEFYSKIIAFRPFTNSLKLGRIAARESWNMCIDPGSR
jgi:hypothetical protein